MTTTTPKKRKELTSAGRCPTPRIVDVSLNASNAISDADLRWMMATYMNSDWVPGATMRFTDRDVQVVIGAIPDGASVDRCILLVMLSKEYEQLAGVPWEFDHAERIGIES